MVEVEKLGSDRLVCDCEVKARSMNLGYLGDWLFGMNDGDGRLTVDCASPTSAISSVDITFPLHQSTIIN